MNFFRHDDGTTARCSSIASCRQAHSKSRFLRCKTASSRSSTASCRLFAKTHRPKERYHTPYPLLRKALKAISQLDEQVAECRMLDQLQPT